MGVRACIRAFVCVSRLAPAALPQPPSLPALGGMPVAGFLFVCLFGSWLSVCSAGKDLLDLRVLDDVERPDGLRERLPVPDRRMVPASTLPSPVSTLPSPVSTLPSPRFSAIQSPGGAVRSSTVRSAPRPVEHPRGGRCAVAGTPPQFSTRAQTLAFVGGPVPAARRRVLPVLSARPAFGPARRKQETTGALHGGDREPLHLADDVRARREPRERHLRAGGPKAMLLWRANGPGVPHRTPNARGLTPGSSDAMAQGREQRCNDATQQDASMQHNRMQRWHTTGCNDATQQDATMQHSRMKRRDAPSPSDATAERRRCPPHRASSPDAAGPTLVEMMPAVSPAPVQMWAG